MKGEDNKPERKGKPRRGGTIRIGSRLKRQARKNQRRKTRRQRKKWGEEFRQSNEKQSKAGATRGEKQRGRNLEKLGKFSDESETKRREPVGKQNERKS